MSSTQIDASGDTVTERYHRQGYVLPIDVISKQDAQALRNDLESAEAELATDKEKHALLMAYPDRLLPSFYQLIRHETLIDYASSILGPNLMVWSAALFIKEANSPKIVSWHQDLTYWNLNSAEETTCWVALSTASEKSGCMKFVPGSHKTQIVPHVDTYHENNLLSRGQEIAADVQEHEAITAALEAGQASMHHGHLFHSSGPNTTNDRRIGVAIRYIKPSMKQKTGDRSLVALVNGEDNYQHFNVAASPASRLCETDFDLCRKDMAIKRRILYQ